MTDHGAEPDSRRPRLASLWRRHRARWRLPLVIILVIGAVAIIDHLGAHRISQVDKPSLPPLVPAKGGAATVELDSGWAGFNPNTPLGAMSSTPTLLGSVLPSAYVINQKLISVVNSDLLVSVEATSTSPLTIQYVINPRAVWSDGVPVTADDFIYAWESQRGGGVDIDGQPDQVASTLGYRDVVTAPVSSQGGKTVTVTFARPYTDWRDMFDHMLPAHIARQVGWNRGFATFNPALDLSAGPFVVHSVSPGGSALLVRNPRWWGTPAVLKRVYVNTTADQNRWSAVLSVNDHAVAQPTSFDLGTLNRVSSLPTTQSAVKPSLRLLQLEFNVTSPIMVRAGREAIAHAIDRTTLLARAFGSIDPDLVINQDHLATAAQSSYTASSAAGEYAQPDLSSTDHLLRTLGYRPNALGNYVDAAGKQLTVRMAVETGDPWIGTVATQISAQLRSAGIAVVTIPVAGQGGMVAAATANSYDMALVTRTAGPYQTTTAAWYSDGVGPAGSAGTQDWSKLDDPEVDQLFSQASEDLDPVTGGSVYSQIDDQLWDQMVALPLFGEPGLLANGVQLAGQQYNPSQDGLLWDVPQWTLLKPGPSSVRS